MRDYITIASPVVEVISCSDYVHDLPQTWANSRPQFLKVKGEYIHDSTKNEGYPLEKYTNDLIQMDLGLNYFANISLKISSSLLFREYVYTFPDYQGKWAMTNRYSTKDPDHMVVSSELYVPEFDDEYYDDFRKATIAYNNGEIPNFDQVRELMPLSYQSVWQVSMPIKLLMRILGQMFYDFGQNTFTQTIYTAFAKVPELKPWLPLIGKYAQYSNMRQSFKTNSLYNSYSIGMVLYSQLIRHEGIDVDGIVSFTRGCINGARRISRDEISIWINVTPERWQQILKVRTSWFAVTDDWGNPNTWSYFLDEHLSGNLSHDKIYLKYFTNDGVFLPSAISDYHLDDDLRVHKGYNAYLPDAFALESRDIVLKRIERYGMNPLLKDYLQMFDEGYVKDNPDNPLRKKWEALEKEE